MLFSYFLVLFFFCSCLFLFLPPSFPTPSSSCFCEVSPIDWKFLLMAQSSKWCQHFSTLFTLHCPTVLKKDVLAGRHAFVLQRICTATLRVVRQEGSLELKLLRCCTCRPFTPVKMRHWSSCPHSSVVGFALWTDLTRRVCVSLCNSACMLMYNYLCKSLRNCRWMFFNEWYTDSTRRACMYSTWLCIQASLLKRFSLQVTERFPIDGAVVKHRRRDLRRGM